VTGICRPKRRTTSRAVFIVDKAGAVRFAEYVPEIGSYPNHDSIRAHVRQAIECDSTDPNAWLMTWGEAIKYADPKNFKYPIDTEKHARAAWSYIHQERNRKGGCTLESM
jgi:hypothetical protein